MQIDKAHYNPELHDTYKALTVKQPYADLMTCPIDRDENGKDIAAKRIEVRSRSTNYRGDLLVCSSANPVDPAGIHLSGVTCGFVEVYGVKPVEQFTKEDWVATCIPEDKRPRKGWGWLLRNPRRVVEMPIKGQLGIYTLIVPKDDITEYPRTVFLGEDGYKLLISQTNGKK